MIRQLSHPIITGPLAGFWYELRDDAGTVLWRRIRSHPLDPTFESITDPDGEIPGYERGLKATQNGTFSLVVPGDILTAQSVFLVGTPPGATPDVPAVDLFSHLLDPVLL